MADLTISTQLKAWKSLTEKQIQSAAARALNRTATSVRAEASTMIREEVKLKAGDVKAVLDVTRVSPRQPLSRMVAFLTIRAKSIPLVSFGARPKVVKTPAGKRIGVTVQVKKERKLVEGGFIAKMKSGRTGVFRRGGKAGYSPDAPRLPIRHLLSTSVVDIARGKGFLAKLEAYARATFRKNLERELKYQLQKGKA